MMPACLCVWCGCGVDECGAVCLCLCSKPRPLFFFLLSQALSNQSPCTCTQRVQRHPAHAGTFIQVSHSPPPPHTRPRAASKGSKPGRQPPPCTFPTSPPSQLLLRPLPKPPKPASQQARTLASPARSPSPLPAPPPSTLGVQAP